ncbi:MAG: biotin/lipoyl-containing protein [Trueperaceae bacterium]|nr:biotin/lipoyl-containing protein [Trueperaceae bacterium]
MIHTSSPKKIRVMLTAFRDGLQSVFGGKVRTDDILPAMEIAANAGVRHFEFGGGARFQAPIFYVGENPFESMDRMRAVVGPDVDLQILTRSVSGVTLTGQGIEALALQARLMHRHGTTVDRNFDFMNDVDNLIRTGRPIVEAGMHHQVTVATMGLPYASEDVHTPAFYIDVARRIMDGDVRVDSLCIKDASGTTDPTTVYETAKGIKKLLGDEIPLWFHTHDTASMAVACNMAAIEGGVDGIDLSVRPLASGTSQPDVRSMWHALKNTGYELDLDVSRIGEVETALTEGLEAYAFNPITLAADARVVNFPMPGGAIGPNVHMMAGAGILDRYGEVLAEFPVVVKAGGAWTSVTPGSQQYWLQAFNNVLYGRWEKIDGGFGRSVLGYFGRPPEPPDPEVVRIAADQLGLEPYEGDPLERAPDSLGPAEAALKEHGLPVTEENVFLVAAAIVPGKSMDLNEGLRLLSGKARVRLPLKETAQAAPSAAAPTAAAPPAAAPPAAAPDGASGAAPAWTAPVRTTCTVSENGVTRTFDVTLSPPAADGASAAQRSSTTAAGAPSTPAAPASPGASAPAQVAEPTAVHSPFGGKVEVLTVHVKVGDTVEAGQVVATVEAMKAEHDVRSPVAGTVVTVPVRPGDEVGADTPIVTIGA